MVHHVISRFVNREWFIRDNEDRFHYRRLLGRALSGSDWRCLAYAIMSNHIHLALVAGESSLESWIKRVHSPYANWLNQRLGRLGPIFADRPSAYVVRPEDEAHLLAYIHNNPVRARVAELARDSHWTSHNAYLHRGGAPTWLGVADGLLRCGFHDQPSMFDDWINITIDPELAQSPIDAVRRLARRRGSLEVGTPHTGIPCEVPLVAHPNAYVRPAAAAILSVVAGRTKISPGRIASRTTGRDASHARRLVVQCGRECGLVGADLATELGISRQAVSRYQMLPVSEADRGLIHSVIQELCTPKPSKY